ncbi:tetratricopeptide repeat protein [Bacteriovorax sp. Seq25_V]|uniref:tetratricopeptide repeat protein n=1 Tax=Bacteriovorax sp. Seq25_V TaxID=1201288 RepID=UPI00038A5157|nr:tetratricopeptide repeat protein [Bacteriovorax sp. Seq25_V]EQC44728.1 PPR repeat protein [Bacteriovorax sp. Seq25_V]
MKFTLLLAMLFLVSCSSSQTEKELTKSELQLELDSLTNDDFKPVQQIRYNERGDYHVIGDLVDDALKDETLAKVDSGKIKELDEKMTGVSGLCYLGKTQEGMDMLDKLYPKYKANPSYWNQLASCYLKNGEYRRAKVFFNKAISLDKDYLPALNNLGVVYLREGKDEKAVAAFKQALNVKNSAKTPMYNLANVYIKYGLLDKANGMLARVLRSDAKDKDVLLSLAYVELYKKDAQGALNYLAKVPSDQLSRIDFSLALLYSYKLAGSKNVEKVSDYLRGQNLSKKQSDIMNTIMRL